MKISELWLREWVDPELTTEELAEQLTMAGLEVDSIKPVAGDFSGVVVGEVLSVESHPNADKLRVCQVATSNQSSFQVVCGAPNVRKGIKVPFATIGAQLSDSFLIKKAKLRGVESNGMLCSQAELQLGEDDAGLLELAVDAPVGIDLRDYLRLNDHCIEIDITPNRSDCLSMRGIARDVGVLNQLPVKQPPITAITPSVDDTFSVELIAEELCPRYVSRIIRGIDISQPSPVWMQEYLRRAGINCRNSVVDVTNYVLLEMGQPMHAFDLAKLDQGIIVRCAFVDEKVKLLNGQQVTLADDTLVIADHSSVQAIAGIMGGEFSAVTDVTVDILLESAFFDPVAIAGRARNYGLHTDSSHRFERGVDYQLQEQAIERATELILSLAGGVAGPVKVTEAEYNLPKARTVTLRKTRIKSGLGLEMDEGKVLDIFNRLGLKKVSGNDDSWTFSVPSYRFDITIEADLLEELARVYGYNRLPINCPAMSISLQPHVEEALDLSLLRRQLIARDYREAICYSFIDTDLLAHFDPSARPVSLQNPISAEMSAMRTSLWPGLVKTLQYNINRQQTRIRLFETGLCFTCNKDTDDIHQKPMLAALIYGSKSAENWSDKKTAVDFYDIKGDLQSLLTLTGASEDYRFIAAQHPALHPGQTAEIFLQNSSIGFIGRLHPKIEKAFAIDQSVYLFEVAQDALLEAKLPSFRPLSRYPEVRRDIAIIVEQSVLVADVENRVKDTAGNYLIELKVFDIYIGQGIQVDKKSVALGLIFQHPSRTLNDDEINSIQQQIIESLVQTFNAVLR